ncbi:hypothetical protein PACTADRAFT_65036 [Pachysolen tannophilus NRRL Y-2460]|uniref:Uncharacterized protein n=1 Tax=Pachysolen tannophilus NRRL Y-2460 TaxID=669874 RepID=A0A1E4TXX2_PACTA|nr:hypothetical protein PACTADRAFT_65036 [Pachysolen tannophilus NRRL Y-2460]
MAGEMESAYCGCDPVISKSLSEKPESQKSGNINVTTNFQKLYSYNSFEFEDADESDECHHSRKSSNNDRKKNSVKNDDNDDYYIKYTNDYIDFTYSNPTTYHFVEGIGELLTMNGFKYLPEKLDWSNLKPGKYFSTRSGTSLIAFIIGKDWKPCNGVGSIVAHVDSLTVKLKPNSVKPKNEGYELLGVAPYSGALSDKWWDRDLGFGGRVLIRKNCKFSIKLINSTPHPIGHIASLAEHFGSVSKGPFNLETQMVPIIGFDIKDEPEPLEDEKSAPLYGEHSLKFLRYVAKLANVKVSEIYGIDFDLFDIQKGSIGGLSNEFFFAPRLDDKLCSYAAINALIEFDNNSNNSNSNLNSNFTIVGLFDNEEIGSLSRQGVRGGFFESIINRVTNSFYKLDDTNSINKIIFANSIILSTDVTHLFNPNFPDAYLPRHRPLPNTGITVKLDPNGHTATDLIGISIIKQLAELNNDFFQKFHVRNDIRSGSTIGPFISSQTGARVIDVGIPQLSMHSIRGMSGSKDLGLGIKFFKGFFCNWRNVYDSFGDL